MTLRPEDHGPAAATDNEVASRGRATETAAIAGAEAFVTGETPEEAPPASRVLQVLSEILAICLFIKKAASRLACCLLNNVMTVIPAVRRSAPL